MHVIPVRGLMSLKQMLGTKSSYYSEGTFYLETKTWILFFQSNCDIIFCYLQLPPFLILFCFYIVTMFSHLLEMFIIIM